MKRFHVNVSVADLAESVRFYSALFAVEPTVLKDDYAKWMLEDPRINFAISQRGYPVGVNHVGFQVDSAEELSGDAYPVNAGGPRAGRTDGRRLLLCEFGQILDHRSHRPRVGDLSYSGGHTDLRFRYRCCTQDNRRVLRSPGRDGEER